jgi:hypothetical protein
MVQRLHQKQNPPDSLQNSLSFLNTAIRAISLNLPVLAILMAMLVPPLGADIHIQIAMQVLLRACLKV